MNMFTIFHNNSLQGHGRKLFIDLLENTEFPTSICIMLYQYILDKFLKYALNYRNKPFEKEEVTRGRGRGGSTSLFRVKPRFQLLN